MSSEANPGEAKGNQQGEIDKGIAKSEGNSTFANVIVWRPLNEPAAPIADLPDSYFEPTIGELKASYDAQVRAREALVNAPLRTREIRERELRAKRDKYPMTRIRVKFPDRTQLERAFPSTDKIRSVYAFVRNCLRDDIKPIKFVLYQTPPRKELRVSDLKVRDLSLYDLQLTPSSVLMLSFLDESLNNSSLQAPLLESILAQARDLPQPSALNDPTIEGNGRKNDVESAGSKQSSSSKSLPKWLKMAKK